MKALGRIGLAVLIVLASVADAFAHTKSETQSVWRIVGSTVHVVYTIPDIEIPRLAHPGGTAHLRFATVVSGSKTLGHSTARF